MQRDQIALHETQIDYAWTNLTYMLHQSNISWANYLSEGAEPDCEDDAMLCTISQC
jgi:hypothetical protein